MFGYHLYIISSDGYTNLAGWFKYRRDATKQGHKITDGWRTLTFKVTKARA